MSSIDEVKDMLALVLNRIERLEGKKEEKEEKISVDEEKNLRPWGLDPTCSRKFPGKTTSHRETVLEGLRVLGSASREELAQYLAQKYQVPLNQYRRAFYQLIPVMIHYGRAKGKIISRVPGKYELTTLG
jgi:hypothetical protein